MVRTTPEDDILRINERIFSRYRDEVVDLDSYELAFARIFNVRKKGLSPKQRILMKDSFDMYANRHDISRERLFKKAGGKDLEKDRRLTRNVVTTEEQYQRKGAQRADLKGLDTAPEIFGRVKGRTVSIRKEFIIVRKKRVVRYRDTKGRFASFSLS